MCVSIRYAHLVPVVAFWLWLIIMGLWSLYIVRRAKKACLNPAAYRNFFLVFNVIDILSFRNPPGWFYVDARDVETLIWYRKMQYVGFILIFIIVFTAASYLVPLC